MSQLTTDSASSYSANNNSQENAGPNRFLEIIRRILLLAGILGAVLTSLYPADALLRVRSVDFEKMQKKDVRRMTSDLKMMSRESGMLIDPSVNTAATKQLAQYIADTTRNRLFETEKQQWKDFHDAVLRTQTGRSAELAKHLSHGIIAGCLYFRPDAVPLNGLAGKIGDDKHLLFIAIKDGVSTRHLEVLFQRPGDMRSYAPSWLLFPFRQYAVYFFIIGLLGYAVLPWYRKGPQELCYSTARSIVVPDFLGAAMAAFFFALPILVITANAATSGPMKLLDCSRGWGVLTIIMWAFAAGLFSITIVALWYSTLSIVLIPGGIRKRTLIGVKDYMFSEMQAIKPAVQDWPKWLKAMAWITILAGSARQSMMMGGMLLTRQIGHGLAISCKDGSTFKIWLDGLPGFERILIALKNAGVSMDAELGRIIEEDLIPAAAKPVSESSGRGQAILAWVLLALVLGGALALHYRPEKIQKVDCSLEFSDEALAKRMELTKQMGQVSEQMKAVTDELEKIMAKPGSATKEKQAELMKSQEELINRFQELSKQHDSIQPTEER